MDVLEIAENIDGYRKACDNNDANRRARESHLYELSEISRSAATALTLAAGEIQLLDSCEIAILDSSADNGFPHTRPKNLVCIPASMCSDVISPTFKTTLIHEAIHVHQRIHVKGWLDGCQQAGWTPISPERIPEEFRERTRINPDTMAAPFWAWDTYHVPLPLFKATPRLNDTPVQWLDLRNGTLFHTAPPSFVRLYGSRIKQPEHPYEIYAETFSEKGLSTSDAILDALKAL